MKKRSPVWEWNNLLPRTRIGSNARIDDERVKRSVKITRYPSICFKLQTQAIGERKARFGTRDFKLKTNEKNGFPTQISNYNQSEEVGQWSFDQSFDENVFGLDLSLKLNLLKIKIKFRSWFFLVLIAICGKYYLYWFHFFG